MFILTIIVTIVLGTKLFLLIYLSIHRYVSLCMYGPLLSFITSILYMNICNMYIPQVVNIQYILINTHVYYIY